MVVDLPAPFGPRKPVTCPGRTVNETPSTAVVLPYLFVRFSATIMLRRYGGAVGRRILREDEIAPR